MTRTLSWGANSKGSPLREGGYKTLREEVFLLGVKGMTGGTGLPAMPVPCVQGLGFPRSVTNILATTARACTGRI